MAAGQPKPAFYIVLFLVVAGLVAFAAWRADWLFPKGDAAKPNGDQTIDPTMLGQTAEAKDPTGLTTVKEYQFTPSQRLPAVKGTSDYTPLEKTDNTVKFALNVWAGWGPIILANDGAKPGKVWKTPDGKEFKLELQLQDDPVAMRELYASGDLHIGWATLDMVPLLMNGLVDKSGQPLDSRVMPRIFQQIDWSNGGDGIVVRKDIKNVADLRGKTIVLAENSPSQYFLLNMLVAGGLQPRQVQFKYVGTAFQAAAAFDNEPDIAACVSWAPDIYTLTEQSERNRMLVTTQTANKLIADVWFARADFAKDHPDIVEALVRGIFDAMEELKSKEGKDKLVPLMATFYNLKPQEAEGMLADAHNTNWAENYQFFLNQNNPANFERIWSQAYYLYRKMGSIAHQPVPFDQVMDFSIIEKLGKEAKYKSQRDEYRVNYAPKTVNEIRGESDPILTNTVVIHFFPNSWELFKKKEISGKEVDELYDPNVNLVLKDAAALAGQFGAARIIIEGHTDSSMKNQVPEEVVVTLSRNRANAVKEALVGKYNLEPERVSVDGLGWSQPADENDPENHTRNRRVEIKVYAAERE
jgi:NitT/TauT family transport system substrate-binding protein